MMTALTPPAVGSNVPNSIADLDQVFPADWLLALREVSPVSDAHSWLLPYWYRAASRWVLYDCMPRACIDPDRPVAPGFSGAEFLERVEGLAPRDRASDDYCPYVSDLQHELYRRYQVYARPFWVLQGDTGGHQIAFDPWQQNLLSASGKPTHPPIIGSLPPCPFDNRVATQLRRLNRLVQLNGSLEDLQKSGDADGGKAHLDRIQKDIRQAEMALLEAQMGPVVDAAHSVSRRSDSRDHLIYTPDGLATNADEAIAAYIETGHFIL